MDVHIGRWVREKVRYGSEVDLTRGRNYSSSSWGEWAAVSERVSEPRYELMQVDSLETSLLVSDSDWVFVKVNQIFSR